MAQPPSRFRIVPPPRQRPRPYDTRFEPDLCVSQANNIIGLLPAAGRARRLGRLPCSKEIYPVAPAEEATGSRTLKSAAEFALEAFRAASIETAFIVLRPGKWDVLKYLADDSSSRVNTAYLTAPSSIGTPFTLDVAYPFVKDATVALGFPDILFAPQHIYVRLLERLDRTGADVVLGLFPARQPSKSDMVATDEAGNVTEVVIKPASTPLRHTWICAVWTPGFTAFQHEYLGRSPVQASAQESELYVGDVIRAAMQEGLLVNSLFFAEGTYIDIGTPEALAEALREQWGAETPLPQNRDVPDERDAS